MSTVTVLENFFKKVVGYDIIFMYYMICVMQTNSEDRSGEMTDVSDKIYHI